MVDYRAIERVAYRTVLLIAALVLLGLAFQQLVTIAVAVLATVLVAILLDAWLVLSSLVRTGRWRYRAAEQMRRMLESCGPDRVPDRVPAFA